MISDNTAGGAEPAPVPSDECAPTASSKRVARSSGSRPQKGSAVSADETLNFHVDEATQPDKTAAQREAAQLEAGDIELARADVNRGDVKPIGVAPLELGGVAPSDMALEQSDPEDPVASQPDLGRVEAEPSELVADYKGYIDKVLLNTIDGWAMDLLAPSRRLKVVAMLNGEVVGEASCDRFRPDLRDNGFGDGYYGFHMVMARAFDRNLPFSVYVETAPSRFELTFPSLAFSVEPLDVAPASSQPEQSAAVEFAVGPGASALEANGDAATAPSDLHAVVEALRVQINRLQSTLDVARPGVAARHGEAPVPYRALPPSPTTLGWTARGTYYQLLSAVR